MVGRGGSQFLTLHSKYLGRNWFSIPDFVSKVKELTSSSSFQFLPLLEGNSGIGNLCWKWILHFRSVKWWILELKWGIDKNVLLKVSIRNAKFLISSFASNIFFQKMLSNYLVYFQTRIRICMLLSENIGICNLLGLYLNFLN